MWKVIREVLGLLWKLIRTLLKNHLRAIIKKLVVTVVFAAGFIALLVFLISKLLF